MAIHLRQICLVASNLDKTIDDLTTIFGVNSAHVDPGIIHFGLANNLLAFGNNFLEVVSPVQKDTAAGRYLDRRKGDGGYMVICQTESRANQQAARQRAADNNVRVAWESENDNISICQFHPGDMIAAFFELDWDKGCDFNGHWDPVGGVGWEDKVKQDVTEGFLGVELQGSDPAVLAERWHAVADLPLDRGDGVSMKLNNAYVSFVDEADDRGPGLSGIHLAVNDPVAILARARERGCYVSDNQVDVCGVHFYLHHS
ncbi:MAG: VOC family protein [Oceanicoccus sp.]